MPLPSGITLLLELATGEANALRSAQSLSKRSPEVLQSAAEFFIEQVLFAPAADSYRILGATPRATRRELRKHMALLMKWLHPDKLGLVTQEPSIDRSRFVHRVTQAWQDLKTEDRRAAYDRALADQAAGTASWSASECWALPPRQAREPVSCNRAARRRTRRLVIHRMEGDTLFGRLLFYMRGQA
jgi:DnaJ-domain-containing protein 1